MPEETTIRTEEATGTPEPVEQAAPEKSSADDMESMLARIPGLANYFGDEATAEKEKPAEEGAPSGDERGPEEPAAEPEIPSPEGEGKQEEEKKREEELPSWAQKRLSESEKRVAKLTAQRTAALEKAESFEAKVKELEEKVSQPPQVVTTTENPLANINSPEELNQQFKDARAVKNWALENLDGGEVVGKDGASEYWDGTKVKKYLAWTERLLTEHIPARKQFLDSLVQHEAEARRAYPNAFKSGTDEAKVINEWVKIFPEVRKFPDYKLIIMDALAGQNARFARAKQANGQKAVRNTPTLAAPSPSSGTKTPQKSVLNSDLLKRIATDRTALDAFSESLIGGGS